MSIFKALPFGVGVHLSMNEHSYRLILSKQQFMLDSNKLFNIFLNLNWNVDLYLTTEKTVFETKVKSQ